MTTPEIVALINHEDAKIAPAIATQTAQIAAAIDEASQRYNRGGRLIYAGAGTSGRLGVLDAAELVPTYGIPPERAVGLIAGGMGAMFKSVEGAEDSAELAEHDLRKLN
ncbi:N-acetylmuramic acid-6-phosphate etherase, partial [Lacticaseibacillus rhamnosus]